MTELFGAVVQTVSGWGDWPDDVRERLRDWNRQYLLTFRRLEREVGLR